MALSSRQWLLKRWLEENHVPGKFWSIREICDLVCYPDGSHAYKFDDRIESHDRCVALGNDVRKINWEMCEGWKLILKDEKGGVKLAESKAEFELWWNNEHDALENRYKMLSTMKAKADRDGIMPIINMAGNIVDLDKPLKPINSFMEKHWFALVDDLQEYIRVVLCDDISFNQNKRIARIIGGEYDGHTYACDRFMIVSNPDNVEYTDYGVYVFR